MSDDVAVTPQAASGPDPAPAGRSYEIGQLHPRTAVLLVSALATVLLLSLMMIIPVPYVVLAAGPATNTLGTVDGRPGGKPLISISGHATYPTSGALDLTTVRIFGGPGARVYLWQALSGWADPAQEVVPEDAVFPPGQTAEQSREENQQEMASSQESATAAALRVLGFDVKEEVGISGFTPGAPSAATLKTKDVILAVDGVATPGGDVLKAQLQKVTPGAKARLTVRRAGRELSVEATTLKSKDGGTALGVLIEPVFRFPFDVKIQIDNVGGPSAGTMFALGIIDKLTPGAMTGGKKIAGTGTMDPDGTVGPIGGIRQKLIGAREQGAQYFLAPAEDCPEVVGHVPSGLSVFKISTLADARAAVERIGAGTGTSGLATCG